MFMKKACLALGCLAALLFLLSSCGSNMASNGDSQTDDDVAPPDADAENDLGGIDMVTLNGSTEGGNAVEVFLAFAPYHSVETVVWRTIDLKIKSAFLPDAPLCEATVGERLTSDAAFVPISILDERNTRLRLVVPSGRDFCSIDFTIPSMRSAFHAEGRTSDGRDVVIDSDLSGSLPFVAKNGYFRWVGGVAYNWVAALDLAKVLPSELLSQLEEDAEGTIRIDADHNAGFLEEIIESITSGFTIFGDPDGNGAADPGEREEENIVAYGQGHHHGDGDGDGDEPDGDPPIDGDQPDDDPPIDGDQPDGDPSVDGDQPDGDTDGETVDCTSQPDGTACDDDDPCTIGDACQGGICAGEAQTCDEFPGAYCPGSENPCEEVLLVAVGDARGDCTHDIYFALQDGSSASMMVEGCASFQENLEEPGCGVSWDAETSIFEIACNWCGVSTFSKENCAPVASCAGQPDGAVCDDGSLCTVGDVCQGESCVGIQQNCDDGKACTLDSCDPATGCVYTDLCMACVGQPDGTACDDGALCTAGDVCRHGYCGGTPLRCDDGVDCTVDSCDPVIGCVHEDHCVGCQNEPQGTACNDIDPCTVGDICYIGVPIPEDGMCVGAPLNCDDSDGCTLDSCDSPVGCVHTGICSTCAGQPDGTACDDGDPCTVGDACSSDICIPGACLPPYCFEAEDALNLQFTHGALIQIRGEPYSGGKIVYWPNDSDHDNISFDFTIPHESNYRIAIDGLKGPSMGVCYANWGADVDDAVYRDMYAPQEELLGRMIYPGARHFGAGAAHTFTIRIRGRNAASTSYDLAFDRFCLVETEDDGIP
ncbi:MAG: hypothetical protein C4523_10080 [Myxococcales bacterium]|nr:MAG: hypothetical protein C4523_10080 [Myxococcales bacterium]